MSEHYDWAFSSYKDEDMVYYAINELIGVRDMRRVFEMQIPKSYKSLRSKPKWSDYAQDIIDHEFKELILILPRYMMGICDEHNGLYRMNNFPNFNCGHMDYTPRCISIGADGEPIQIGGCDPDDVGKNFTKFFIMGLKGDWQGINFSGCDNPIYREEN